MDTISMRLKKIRSIKKLTQAEVSSKAGIGASLYRQYECGNRVPKLGALKKIATALDVDVAFLQPLKTDTPMSILALIFNLADEYGDIVIENKGGTVLFGIDHLNNMRENLQLAEAKSAHDKLSTEEFKEWLINYPPKIHNGEIENK